MASNLIEEDSEPMSSQTDAENYADPYLVQHLRFTPSSFCNGLYNAFGDYIKESLQYLGKHFNENYGNIVTEEDVHNGMRSIVEKVEGDKAEIFDKLEHYLTENIFVVPDRVVFEEDACQLDKKYTAEDQAKLDSKIQDLRDRILAVKISNAELMADVEEADQAQKYLNFIDSHIENTSTHLTESNGEINLMLNNMQSLLKVAKGT